MDEDLIRRSDAIKATLTTDVNGVRLEDVIAVTDAAADAIEAIPTIEPKRGEWTINNNGYAHCSECKRLGLESYNFCPNCGCAMTKE